jgi:hypothetical protein
LEEEEIEKDINSSVTVNFFTGKDSWTLVQRRKKNKVKKDNKKEKWNAQQRQNFEWFGDRYRGEPYKNYRNVNIGPPLAIAPLQQQVSQPPVVQPPNIQPPIALPYIPPAPPVAAAQPPIPLIIVTPPLRPFTPDGHKHHQLEAIPEEDEPIEPQCPRLAEASPSDSDDYNTPLTLQQLKQIDKEAKEFINQMIWIFNQLSDIWPFHRRQQIDERGWTRFRLT